MKSKLPAANWLLFSVLLLGLPATARSQNGLAITGQVLDDSTKKPLENVQVEIPRLRRGDVTDDSGNFKIAHLGAGVYTIKVSRLGYKPKTVADISVNEKLTAPITIYLEETRIELPGVKVEAERVWEKHLTEASVIGVKSMKAAELKNIPGMLDDPVRAVQVFNGVAGVGDYVSYLAVRGSSPNQNQIYVDGVRIPNPYRFRLAVGGGLSSINPHTVDNLYLHLGGYSAAYGDALSSILEIETRRGSSERFHAQGNLNFTDATAVFEG
ncbi:MAG TPA: carboxypeptidase-like regulatory domain-containing protein, partial [bacterium]